MRTVHALPTARPVGQADRVPFRVPVLVLVAAFLASPLASADSARAENGRPLPVWIDADPACFVPKVADVDDCWAILLALDAPELRVVGVSSVFGNVDRDMAHRSARALLTMWARARGRPAPPLYRGAPGPGLEAVSPAARALAVALGRERLAILALGPLTNIAQMLRRHPGKAGRIRRLAAVMGRRPGEIFLTGGPALHVHDLNLIKDPEAASYILSRGLPVTLTPFAAGQRVALGRTDLARLTILPAPAGSLARASAGWAAVWRHWLGAGGMPLFDAAAIAALIAPDLLDCDTGTARVIRRRALFSSGRWYLHVVSSTPVERRQVVRYCARARPVLQEWVMNRLTRGQPRLPK